MGDNSGIDWTDATWNPTTGCTKLSAGCHFCYAERMAKRLQAMGQPHYANGFQVAIHPDALELPLRWKRPRRVFVDSMSDLFHVAVPSDFIQSVFGIMEKAKWHTYQVLTKRAERLYQWVNAYECWLQYATGKSFAETHPNVHLGVSIEDQNALDNRLPWLLLTPAAVRFLSCEPLLGPLNLKLNYPFEDESGKLVNWGDRLHWVIVGGESGPHCRPMDVAWACSIHEQCKQAGVAFFMKQLGGNPDKRHRLEDFPEDLRVRQFPEGS